MNDLGRYVRLHVLGSGAFATVWLARDEALQVDVAVKVLADNWAADADVRERFLSEARLLRRISSPRVIGVHDVGVTGDQPYFVMDLVSDGTLADLVRGGCAPDRALRLGAEAALATQALHDAGVLHRDLKPSNLLVVDRGPRPRLVVADLGLAKALAEGSGYTVTAGTPGYVAPEQAAGRAIDARTDVYSLAAITYELLAGRQPYPASGMLDVVSRDPGRRPDPLPDTLDLPIGTGELLDAALATDPLLRPSTAQAFGEALLALVADGPQPGDPPPPVGGPAQPGWSVRFVLLLAALAFLAAAGLGYVLAGG